MISTIESTVNPLSKEVNLAYFDASISGKDEDYQRSTQKEIELNTFFSNKEIFEKLKFFKDSANITNDTLKRELLVLYDEFISNQVDKDKLEKSVVLQTAIEQKYSTFRAMVNNKALSDNDIEEILATSTKTDEVKAAWLASKEVGKVVSQDIITLVKHRNEIAKELGFENYHTMSLTLSEQKPEEIAAIFDELDNLTKPSYMLLKSEIDDYLAKKFNVKKEDLQAWHYQNRYFQEAPKMYNVDLDKYYKNQDVVALTIKFYKSIGIEIEDMVAKSDLYEKPGKNQHAYCTSIDKDGDVRVLCNVKNNSSWMNTMLHEFGHATYDKYIDRSLPYFLKDPAHTFTTEAIAMIFGRFASNPQWIKDVVGITDEEKAKIAEESFKILRLEQLVFSRWVQVMYNFEKNLYANPDQDLNKLWWDMVEKYQMIKRPENRNEPDWATKIHIATSPCYYHNYLLGELLASQFYNTIVEKVIKSDDFKNQSFYGNAEVGKYFIDNVFKPANKWFWNDMIEKATGEKLTAKYYAKQFVN
ncbi:MAG: hypothetical protein A2046_04445 [Bacteroidetes bacterium GWA2_30_7]|nr:MAG: hypothetical protein A2046_04445 [Bacteroidetes bacterium GWA2_30_7]